MPAISLLSQSAHLLTFSKVFSAISIGFGINAFVRPRHALTLFEFNPPAAAADQQVVDGLILVYGARNLFMGAALFAAAHFENRETLGVLLVGTGLVAVVDGAVCKAKAGKGEWGHWIFTPVLVAVGCAVLGALDKF
ncbi:hypothetical protein HGRIS_011410 [Hohenbuehelia grisea]|uniref:Integral membrane protein n=1 Tax=Hohenbuehelia grisea TaxID=104357 RepID=A0ABR3JX78_9AGAR